MATLDEILALLPDNTTGDIGAEDVRAAVTALWERTSGVAPVEGPLFDVAYTPTVHAPGLAHWNADAGTLEVDLSAPGVRLQVGHEVLLTVRNNSGATIANGRPVRITGAIGNRPTVSLDQGLGRCAGVATHDIPNNTDGKITVYGLVNDLNLSAFADGALLYSSSAGALQAAQTASFVGIVLRSHATMGTLLARPTSLAQPVGTTAQRPTNVPPGFLYFDTTLNNPVWWSGSDWFDSPVRGEYVPTGNSGVTPNAEPYVTLTDQGSQALFHLIAGPTFSGPYLVGIGNDNGASPGCLIANKAAGIGLAINNQTADASGSAYGLRVTNSAPNAPGASFEATAGNAPAVSMNATQATSIQNGYITRWSGLPAGVFTEYGYVRGSGLFTWNAQFRTTGHFDHRGTLSFFGTTGAVGVAKQAVTGSRGGNAALASLLTALAAYGLITDSTTA